MSARYTGNHNCHFSVWAPLRNTVELHFPEADRKLPMKKDAYGYFHAKLEDISPGSRYLFIPDGEGGFPDPESYYQPDGVHGPSAVVDHGAYAWQDAGWKNIPLHDLVLYELHVGAFTSEGTFEAIIPRLEALADTGINAIELLPVHQFPGTRNWGYDGVYLYAVQHSYGGPEGLKKLVDACHRQGIAVLLDVVYNHIGPEGNYLEKFGPYFTDMYRTPWGRALNLDRQWSDGVRSFLKENVLYWMEAYHLDGLRADAIHEMYDRSAVPFWPDTVAALAQKKRQLGRSFHLTTECHLNNPRVIQSPDTGGLGFDAQWLDDFNHALYSLLDAHAKRGYEDFGRLELLAKAFTDGFVYSGEFSVFHKQKFGASSATIPCDRFIVFISNHDQVGNREGGERLAGLLDFERLKIAAATLLLSPYVPLLFMGQEYGEDQPFLFFTDYGDEELARAAQEGRKQAFAVLGWTGEPPFPNDEETFLHSKLQWEKRESGNHGILLQWYRLLIRLRRENEVFCSPAKGHIEARIYQPGGLLVHRSNPGGDRHIAFLLNLSEEPLGLSFPLEQSSWEKILDSRDANWLPAGTSPGGTGPATLTPGQDLQLAPLSIWVYQDRLPAGEEHRKK